MPRIRYTWSLFAVQVLLIGTTLRTAHSQGLLNCAHGTFRCDSGDVICGEDWCDGYNDCDDLDAPPDGSDERDCYEAPCPSWSMECSDHRKLNILPICIREEWICDDEDDCRNSEDEAEEACSAVTCPGDQFACDSGVCIDASKFCDTIWDCLKGEDESKERNCTEYPACNTSTDFTCKSDQCINRQFVCDGDHDCRDGSDEAWDMCVLSRTCREGEQACRNGNCVPLEKMCDGNNDCGDFTDEDLCVNKDKNECENNSTHVCQQKCVDTMYSYYCECDDNLQLAADGSTCQGSDLCTDVPGTCSQTCQIKGGSALCSCADGYTLDTDGSTCRKADDIQPYLLFANRYYIRKMSLDGKTFERLTTEEMVTSIIDFDYQEGMVYYADYEEAAIKRLTIDGESMESVDKHFSRGVEGLAVDWVGRKLYWTSMLIYGIYVSEINGTNVKALIPGRSTYGRGIAVHPSKGYVLWTDWNYYAFIGRMGMDGSGMTKIIDSGVVWPNGITVDYYTNRVWWCDAYLDQIEYSDLNGGNRHVVRHGTNHPYAMNIFEDTMYWVDWSLHQVESANKFTGANATVIKETLQKPYDIHVYHPLRQPQSKNPCGDNNGGCSHLCLIAPPGDTYSCACPNDFVLGNDSMTCHANCTPAQFECGLSDHKCINAHFVCDGVNNCKGGEDEPEICKPRVCAANVFQCDNELCIYNVFVCDGYNHCRDGSDEREEYCPYRQCQPHEFRCDSGQCITRRWFCDGTQDCTDGVDEHECKAPKVDCEPHEFTCDNSHCVKQEYVCDWDDDCGDMSDEPEHCKASTCEPGWFSCKRSYRCIPEYKVCNGRNDCRDNSDEDEDACRPCDPIGDFECVSDGECIPKSWICDFSPDCVDDSDEEFKMCNGTYRDCTESELRCDNGQCLSASFFCDGTEDCNDKSDENNCNEPPEKCRGSQFQCETSLICISVGKKCNGERDCFDASDEAGCTNNCTDDMWKCDNNVCVEDDYRCDNYDDCGDGSDETVEVCKTIDCPEDTRFRCPNFQCIPRWQLCDQIDDCGDGFDESEDECLNKECESYEEKCANGQCVDIDFWCDNYKDCEDGSDETGCREGTCLFENGGCQHICTDVTKPTVPDPTNPVTGGYYCSCLDGYEHNPEDPKRCLDVDECASFKDNKCPHTCENKKGFFMCKCLDGFKDVYDDGTTCNIVNQDGTVDRGTLLFGDGAHIRKLTLAQRDYTSVVITEKNIHALDLDIENNMVYWTDLSLKKIKRSLIPTSASQLGIAQDLEQSDVSYPEGIAVDWLGKNLYWTDRRQASIYVAKLDGRFQTKLIYRENRFKPTDIVVNPNTGYMYWINDYHKERGIESSWMSGRNEKVIIDSEILEPRGLAADLHMQGRLFWSDLRKEVIESCKPDGSDRTIVLTTDLQHPFKLDVYNSQIFWTTQEQQTVFSQDKFGDGKIQQIVSGLNTPSGIKLLQAQRYTNRRTKRATDPCSSLDCNGLCLLTPGDPICRCPDGSSVVVVEGKTVCDLNDLTTDPRDQPQYFECQNRGFSVADEDGVLTCKCQGGWTGKYCQTLATTTVTTTARPTTTWPTTTTTTSTSTTSVIRERTTATTTPSTTEKPVGGHDDNKGSGEVVAIIIPILLVICVLAAIAVWIVWMYRTGRLRKKTTGRVEYRNGTESVNVGGGITSYDNPSVAMEPVSFEDGNANKQFANPLYDVLKAPPTTTSDAMAVDLEAPALDEKDSKELFQDS